MTKADHFKIADDGTTQISHEYQVEQLLESIRASIARLTTFDHVNLDISARMGHREGGV